MDTYFGFIKDRTNTNVNEGKQNTTQIENKNVRNGTVRGTSKYCGNIGNELRVTLNLIENKTRTNISKVYNQSTFYDE